PNVYICPESVLPANFKVLPQTRIGVDVPGFHYVFVNANGEIENTRGPKGTQVGCFITIIIVAVYIKNGSPLASMTAILAAADVVAKMTKYMPSSIFTKLAGSAGVGVFTAVEKVTVFHEYARYANGNCSHSCTGACSHTCTTDGRKMEGLAGLGGVIGAVLDDNLLCTSHDPYRHTQNILSHEFTHTIHDYGLPTNVKSQVTAAYHTAKASSTWVLSSYHYMPMHVENWSLTFTLLSTGGMVSCGSSLCSSEHEAREHLRIADPGLYNVLTHIFTDNRPGLLSGMTICPTSSVVG
ncbi:unnamed protein product, partial [Candidula unifasciata]